MITVLNKKNQDKTNENPNAVYIGRGSPLENPYREESIKKYKEYMLDSIKSRDPIFCHAMNGLMIKKLRSEDIDLVCFCNPLPCHGDIIKEFLEQNKYCINWFSNMVILDDAIKYDGNTYNSVENFYQAMKTLDKNERKKISLLNPYSSKQYVKKIEIRSDWKDIKLKVMEFGLRKKFKKGSTWLEKLKSFPYDIIEYNNWNDKFWGVCVFTDEGENHLGKIITKIKSEYL